jgi:transposase
VKKRREFQRRFAGVEPNRLFFLDESAAHTAMARTHGRAPMGERVVDAVPLDHWRTTTMVSAMGLSGVTASLVFEGPMDALAFQTYVEQILVPTLRAGDVVLMDNLSSHKVAGIAAMIEEVGARVEYLPPYSPDFNPIEPMWSKVKTYLRKAAARTQDALWSAIGDALATVTSADCHGFFASCGFAAART